MKVYTLRTICERLDGLDQLNPSDFLSHCCGCSSFPVMLGARFSQRMLRGSYFSTTRPILAEEVYSYSFPSYRYYSQTHVVSR